MRAVLSRTVLLGLAGLTLCLAPAAAQQHPNAAQGFNPSGSFAAGDIDNVNLFNGNLVIRIPLGQSYPVNAGLSYGLTLVYNSQVWEHQLYAGVTQSLPYRTSNAGLGWTLSLGRLNPPATLGEFETYRDSYMSPDGARHTFYPTLHEGETENLDIQYSRDGSYLRHKELPGTVELPDGTVHTFNAEGYPTQIADRFNNAVSICYDCCSWRANEKCIAEDAPWPWRIRDSHTREHWIYFRSTGLPYQPVVVDRVELDSFGTQPVAKYEFDYNIDSGAALQVKGCGNQDPATQNIPVALLTSLTLPDGSAYTMPEHFNTPTGLCKTGMIKKLGLPTLGAIEWDYITYSYPTDSTNRPFWQNTTGVGTRTLKDASGSAVGTWTYATVLSPTPVGTPRKELVNTVTDPLGHRATRYFSVCASCTADRLAEYGLPLSREQTGDGAGRFLSSKVFHQNGTLLRSTYVRYEHDLDPAWATMLSDRTRLNQRQASQRTVFHDDVDRFADENLSDFDGYGHYRTRSTGGDFPGNNTRTATTGFNPPRGTYGQASFSVWPVASPWLLGTFTFSWESENGQLQYRSYCFDPNNGFLMGRRIHLANGSGYGATDLVELFNHDGRGNTTSEKYFGGDGQSLPATSPAGYICNLASTLTSPAYKIDHTYSYGARATSSYTVGSNTLYVLKQTIDRSTGLPLTSQDTADQQTSYAFDSMGRITTITPPQGAVTSYTYRRATEASSLAQVTVSVNLNNVNYGESQIGFDGFGRPVTEEERMPNASWAKRTTDYNALGWKTRVTERDSPYATLFAGYDPFGRPTMITPPDSPGNAVILTYTGQRQVERQAQVATTATSQTAATTTEVYDRHGRLYEVTEPNGTVTRYEYDTGNHLKRVCQSMTISGTGTVTCGQERVFTYDNRGLLLWENHPEKSANSYGQGHDIDYLGYDARGHATRKVDGTNDLTFVYDAYERLTLIRQTGNGNCITSGTATGPRCLKSFTYATANSTVSGLTNASKGKLTAASRYNYFGLPFNATVEIKETYQYTGRGGRLAQLDTANIFNGTQNEVFRQTFTWNESGDLSSHTYPDCTVPALCGSAPRSQSYGYTRGRLTSVTGFATSITYHPSGLMATVVRSNGTTDVQAADPFGMVRPAEISARRTSDNFGLWTTGAYNYDGSGNVWKTGNATYLYDSLSRVLSGTVYSGPYSNGTASTQSYAYDKYGNLTSTTTGTSTVYSTADTPTNRLTGGGYDTRGNLTSWSGNSYEYDAFDQMSRLVSGGEDWRYVYTPGDERFWAYKVGGTGSLWTLRGPDGKVLREYSAHLGWINYRDNLYRGGILLATVASAAAGGAVSHLHTDHLGTPRLITDATGSPATAKYHAYYPYGQELAATYTAAYTDRMRFTGHERDLVNPGGQGDDLDYMHARHYSPVVGRFLSVDPKMVQRPRQPHAWNRYSYVWSNPLKLYDPDGRDVTYAPIFGDALLKGIKSSQTLGVLYHRLRFSRSIHWEIKPLQAGKQGSRAYSSISLTRSSQGTQVKITSFIPLRQSWQTTAELIGHEGAHGEEALDSGMTLRQRYLLGLPGVRQNPLAGPDAYESDYALRMELNIRDEIRVSQQASSSRSHIIDSLSTDVYGDLSALFDFEGTLYMDGINLTGVLAFSSPRF